MDVREMNERFERHPACRVQVATLHEKLAAMQASGGGPVEPPNNGISGHVQVFVRGLVKCSTWHHVEPA
jgi:hypothetical protein